MADLVINNVNTSELLEYYGLKSDTRPDANKIKRFVSCSAVGGGKLCGPSGHSRRLAFSQHRACL